MTREEMIAKGLTPNETKHNGHRRAFFHDYNRPGTYMITMVTEGRKRVFGCIEGHIRGKQGTADYPHLHCSALGSLVLQEEVKKIPMFYPMVEVWKVALMPDHIHLLINVKKKLPAGKHLGNIVRGFKTGCTRAWWKLEDEASCDVPCGEAQGTMLRREDIGEAQGTMLRREDIGEAQGTMLRREDIGEAQGTVLRREDMRPSGEIPSTVPEVFPSGLRPVLFQAGYHDRIVMRDCTLDNIFRYMEENPFRAKLREETPDLMQRQLHLWIQGREYAAFGNLFLLKYPEKEQVFFHRRSKEGIPTHLTPEYDKEKALLLQHAEQGAVLVTPGISEGEKGVVQAALAEHFALIILQKEPITEYWKPSQGRFYACATGRLLILAPWKIVGNSDYSRFHSLNDMAREICQATDTRLLGFGC
ncbi:MAG: hypothetical protein IKQ51_03840 [Bacteroidaceae bacterium]|nr:hypothetical protein [Bacteroidaceae bacterium]